MVGAAVALLATAALVVPTAASAHEGRNGRPDRDRDRRGAVRVVAQHLNGPFGLDAEGRDLFVAQSDAGQITHVDLRNGRTRASVTGLVNPTSVAIVGNQLAIVTGEAGGPPEQGVAPPPNVKGDSSLFFARPGGRPRLVVDLEQYEREHNTDGQRQFDPKTGALLDSLSNPFDVIEYGRHGSVLVADAGANAVLLVSRRGHVEPFFVPPVINTGACKGRPNNDPAHTGCDPVPTGLAYGPRGTLYVSTLTSEVRGEGRVYKLDARTGRVLDVMSGFSGPTGVAVSRDGTLYVSEVMHGAPEGEGPPPPGLNPASIGRIVRVSRHGHRTYAAVTMPTGLDFDNGRLFSSAWSTAGFLGMRNKGQVVQVGDRAFGAPRPAPTARPPATPRAR